MKNSNGYGSIHKMNDTKRRKPWVARITISLEIGEDGKAKQRRKILGTFATKKEAMECLAQYNANKELYLNPKAKFTFEEIFNQTMDSRKSTSTSTRNSYNMAFNIMSELKDRNFDSLKLMDYQSILNNSGRRFESLRKVRSMISLMYSYSIKNNLINGTQNIAEWIDIGKNEDKKEKEIFTDEEIEILWKNKDKDICKIILILIYSGLRISELLDLRKENVNIKERYLDIKQGKTDNSVRKVPIALKILPFIKEFYDNNIEYLVTNRLSKQFKYSNFKREYFDRAKESLGLNPNLSIHGTRHTCVSLLVKCGKIPPTFVKLIIGHSSNELFEKTYTHLDIKDLIKYIDMI